MKRRYLVDGMHCAACEASVKKEVSKLPDVTSVEVRLESKDMIVEGNAKPPAVIEAVKSAGFDAKLAPESRDKQSCSLSQSKEQRFLVEGMHCENCQASVEKAVTALPNVEAVEVRLASEDMTVKGTFDPSSVIKAVEDAGFEAKLAPESMDRQSQKQHFLVNGMHCENCQASVEKAVTALPNVEAVEVRLASEDMTVKGTFDPSSVIKAVEDAGFEAKLAPESMDRQSQKQHFLVNGMHCENCQAAVEKAVTAVPGVKAVEVRLENNDMFVTGDADPTSIINAVEEAGYEAELATDETCQANECHIPETKNTEETPQHYLVNGMHCENCQAAVEKAVAAVPGVEAVEVRLENNDMFVTGDADPTTIMNAVEEAGYEAELATDETCQANECHIPETKNTEETPQHYLVNGMHCENCQAAVEKAVAAVPGVEAVEVRLENNDMFVTGDADPTTIINAVEEAGYEAKLATEETCQTSECHVPETKEPEETAQHYLVNGMHCAACQAAVEKAVKKLPQVKDVDVRLMSQDMVLEGSPDPKTVIKAIEDAGYEATLDEQSMTQKPSPSNNVADSNGAERYLVHGMSCAACQAAVEKAVKAVPGVETAEVRLMSQDMLVTGEADPAAIVNAVEDAGYEAEPVQRQVTKASDSMSQAMDLKLEASRREREYGQSLKRQFWWSLIVFLPLFYLSMGSMIGLPMPFGLDTLDNTVAFAFTQFLLVIPVLILNRNYFIHGFKGLFNGSPTMDTLVGIGAAASVTYSTALIYVMLQAMNQGDMAELQRLRHQLYYEGAGMILVLVTLGKWLESRAKGKSWEALEGLMDLAPETVEVKRGEATKTIPLAQLQVGDVFVVRPGERVAADGIVREGYSSIDTSAMTGESIPVERTIDDDVTSGTLNLNGYLEVEATRVGQNSSLAQIIKMVQEASVQKAPVAKMVDKISAIFVPAVLTISAITFIVWLLTGHSISMALTTGISVLVISCPCALGLATPVAIMVGTGKGAQEGVLFKDGVALEVLGKITDLYFDKTGTLTYGEPKISDWIVADGEESKALYDKLASLEASSEHPLAQAILAAHEEEGTGSTFEVSDFEAVPGRGIIGTIDDVTYFAGNEAFIEEQEIVVSDNLQKQFLQHTQGGKTVMYFANEDEVLAIVAVADQLREEAPKTLKTLRSLGIKTHMMTGDHPLAAEAIAKEAGIEVVHAGLLPQHKGEILKREKEENPEAIQAMVGDGVNDAPALALADVGVAMGQGTDIALASADVVLLGNNLKSVLYAIRLSRRTLKIIKGNLFWALIYNAIGIPLAAGVFYNAFNWLLSPMFAAAAMSFSSLFVVTNALRLRKDPEEWDE